MDENWDQLLLYRVCTKCRPGVKVTYAATQENALLVEAHYYTKWKVVPDDICSLIKPHKIADEAMRDMLLGEWTTTHVHTIRKWLISIQWLYNGSASPIPPA